MPLPSKTSKDIKDLVFAVMIGSVCESAQLLQFFIAASYKQSIKPITNPNPMSSH
jgi:hypothetical protein